MLFQHQQKLRAFKNRFKVKSLTNVEKAAPAMLGSVQWNTQEEFPFPITLTLTLLWPALDSKAIPHIHLAVCAAHEHGPYCLKKTSPKGATWVAWFYGSWPSSFNFDGNLASAFLGFPLTYKKYPTPLTPQKWWTAIGVFRILVPLFLIFAFDCILLKNVFSWAAQSHWKLGLI